MYTSKRSKHGDSLVFLHSVKEGPANQSYGLQVAALAGDPQGGHTEAPRRYLDGVRARARRAAQLRFRRSPSSPRFGPGAAAPPAASPPATPPVAAQPAAARPEDSRALGVLRAVDPDTLEPA